MGRFVAKTATKWDQWRLLKNKISPLFWRQKGRFLQVQKYLLECHHISWYLINLTIISIKSVLGKKSSDEKWLSPHIFSCMLKKFDAKKAVKLAYINFFFIFEQPIKNNMCNFLCKNLLLMSQLLEKVVIIEEKWTKTWSF